MMAKKKIGTKEAQAVKAEQEESPEFTRSAWAGHEQFQCKHCAFDTLEANVMIEHLFWVHSILLEPTLHAAEEPAVEQEANIELKETQDAKTNVD
jgi:hypothetical protein